MRCAIALTVAAILAMPSRVDADESYQPPDFLSATPPLPADLARSEVWRLPLSEAIRIAVHDNLDVVLERHSVEISKLARVVARGAFEPSLSAGYRHSNVLSPPSTSQEGSAGEIFDATDDSWQLSIDQRLHTGTNLSLALDNARAKSSLGTAVEPLNYRSTLTFNISQPLLRGFSTDLAMPEIEVLRATIADKREREQLAIAIAALVDKTEGAYYRVLQSLYGYDLAKRSEKAAADQLALTQRQIDAGTLPPSDLIGAQSTLAQRQLGVVEAEATIQQATDQLRAVLNLPHDQWKRTILPTDVPHFTPDTASLDDAMALATKNRPELAQAVLDQRAADLGARKAENDRLPQLDLGLSGTLFGQSGAYRGALSQLGSTDARGWAVFVNLTWAPLQRSTRAAAEIARVQQRQTTLRKKQIQQTIWLEVRDAVRNQQSAERKLLAAARFRDLAERSLAIEQRRFVDGMTQNLAVAQRQDALAAARLAELDALLAHSRAETTLQRATGRLLAERHIEIE